MISLQRVAKAYGARKIFTDVTLSIHPDDNLCIVGESGCGKTLLVRLLLCAEHPTGGTISADGMDLARLPRELLPHYRLRLGVVSDALPLVPHWTLEENVALPLTLRGMGETQRRKVVTEMLKRLDIASFASRYAADLPAQARQLGMIARAVVTPPTVLIADEPTRDMDEHCARTVLSLLKEAHKRGATVVMLTRDERLVSAGARVVRMADGKCIAGAVKSQEAAKEHLGMFPGPTLRTTHAEEKSTAGHGKSGRKIRITSIGSDLG